MTPAANRCCEHRISRPTCCSDTPRKYRPAGFRCRLAIPTRRSEAHTSELQSLMRISYAVFCLKKKNKDVTIINIHKVNVPVPILRQHRDQTDLVYNSIVIHATADHSDRPQEQSN